MLAEIEIKDQLLAKMTVDGASKIVPLVDVTNLLSNIITVDESSWLPPNLVFLKRNGGNVGAVYYFPEQIKTMRYGSERVSDYEIRVPASLFFFSLTALKGDKFKINKMAAALIPNYEFGSSKMYQWPFPNSSLTYSPGFCWGSDNVAKRMYEGEGATLEQLPILYQRFFDNTANDDLGWKFRNDERSSALKSIHPDKVKPWTEKTMNDFFRNVSIGDISSALHFEFQNF